VVQIREPPFNLLTRHRPNCGCKQSFIGTGRRAKYRKRLAQRRHRTTACGLASRPNLRIRTRELYEIQLRRHILPPSEISTSQALRAPPKSDAGRRTVRLPPFMLEEISEHLHFHDSCRRSRYADVSENLLFTGGDCPEIVGITKHSDSSDRCLLLLQGGNDAKANKQTEPGCGDGAVGPVRGGVSPGAPPCS